MMKKNLSNRISHIVDLVPICSTLADIGCDHAHISIYLKEIGRVGDVIASDLREGPLNRAKENVAKKGFKNSFSFRLCSGLDALKKGEVEVILISGMGGILIRDLLEKGIDVVNSVKTLVLEPQSDADLVRKFLREHGFFISEERMAKEGFKFYPVIRAERMDDPNGKECAEVFDRFGAYLLKMKDPILKEFLLQRRTHFDKLLTNTDLIRSEKEETETRLRDLKKEAKIVEEALSYYDEEMERL